MSDTVHDMVRAAIEEYRRQIDEADVQLLEALAARFKATDAIGRLKKDKDLPIFNPEREAELLKALNNLASKYDLSPAFIEKLWSVVLEESKQRQLRIN